MVALTWSYGSSWWGFLGSGIKWIWLNVSSTTGGASPSSTCRVSQSAARANWPSIQMSLCRESLRSMGLVMSRALWFLDQRWWKIQILQRMSRRAVGPLPQVMAAMCLEPALSHKRNLMQSS